MMLRCLFYSKLKSKSPSRVLFIFLFNGYDKISIYGINFIELKHQLVWLIRGFEFQNSYSIARDFVN